jgi:hypothetical protein
MSQDDKINESWDAFVSGLTEGDDTRRVHRDAIVEAAIKKYVTSGGDVDILHDAQVEDTVDGHYWVSALVFVEHGEVFPSKKK